MKSIRNLLVTTALLLGFSCAQRTSIHRELLSAAAAGQIDSVKALVAKGANVNYRSTGGTGMTALHWAIYEEEFEVARFLINSGADPTILDARGDSAVRILEDKKDSPEAEALLAEIRKRGKK